MRTTVSIDDDLLAAAKSLARAKNQSVGQVLSDLVRKGLRVSAQVKHHKVTGFPTFKVPAGARPITLEDVKKDEDEA